MYKLFSYGLIKALVIIKALEWFVLDFIHLWADWLDWFLSLRFLLVSNRRKYLSIVCTSVMYHSSSGLFPLRLIKEEPWLSYTFSVHFGHSVSL